MAICFFGPAINPEAGLPQWLGLIIGLILIVVVAYQKWGQEYRLNQQGLCHLWPWQGQRQEIAWEDLGEIEIRRGFTQTLLNVGNLFMMDKTGRQQMVWFGLADPKGVKAAIEARRP